MEIAVRFVPRPEYGLVVPLTEAVPGGLLVRGGWSARKRTIPLGPFFAAGGLVAAGFVVF